MNLNDCVEGTRYEFTDQNREDLQELVREADKNCTVRSDLFINHADFFPQLHPKYKVLVPAYTRAAQAVNATVHDGFESLHAIKLRDSMHFAPESTLEVVKMYISAVRVMLDQQPTRDVQQHADARMAATPDIISSDEEFESSDSLEHWRPESPPESRESAEDVRQHLLEKFHKWNIDHEEKRPVPRCLSLEGQTLLPSCMPARLSKDDDRFNEKKKERVFVCDTPWCKQVVRFSSKRTQYQRAECEFAGSFSDHSWHDLPAALRKEAWEARFIDATWHCHHICSAEVTLNEEQNKKRNDRIRRHQKVLEEQAEARKRRRFVYRSAASSASPASGKGGKAGNKGRAPASSFAARSAYPASNKGAEAASLKRSRADMEGGQSKGTKKGGSTTPRRTSCWSWTP